MDNFDRFMIVVLFISQGCFHFSTFARIDALSKKIECKSEVANEDK